MVFSLFYPVHRARSPPVTVSVSLFVVKFLICVPTCVCQFFSLSSSSVHGLGLSVLLPSRLQVLRPSTTIRPQRRVPPSFVSSAGQRTRSMIGSGVTSLSRAAKAEVKNEHERMGGQ